MVERAASDILSGMSPETKKNIITEMFTAVVGGMDETEKRELLQSALIGQRESRQLSSMVEH
ncbi:MAG: hypothetical protein HZB33_12575 [Nitrospirae bacterium]|nr:hypothetical protein [Nitrospirota bacterium]